MNKKYIISSILLVISPLMTLVIEVNGMFSKRRPISESIKKAIQASQLIRFPVRIKGTDGLMGEVPFNIINLSNTLKNLVKDLANQSTAATIPIPYSVSILEDINDMLQKTGYERLKNYSIERLVEITKCMQYLDFPKENNKAFFKQLYLACKGKSLAEMYLNRTYLETLSQDSVQEIFGDPLENKLRNLIIKKLVNNEGETGRKTILQEDYGNLSAIPYIGILAFSPNNKILASSRGHSDLRGDTENSGLLVWQRDQNGKIQQNYQIITGQAGTVQCIDFSPDNSIIVTGSNCSGKAGLLLRKIHENNDINPYFQDLTMPDNLVIYFNDIVFHPSGKTIIASFVNKTDRRFYWNDKIILWKIFNGEAKESQLLDSEPIGFDNVIHFNSDGTLMITYKRASSKSLNIWSFNKESGMPEGKPIKIDCPPITSLSFIPNSKKFIATQEDSQQLILGDLSDFFDNQDITFHPITIQKHPNFNAKFKEITISPNGKIILLKQDLPKEDNRISILSMIDDAYIEFICQIKLNKSYNFFNEVTSDLNPHIFTSDSREIAIGLREKIIVLTLLTEEENSILLHTLKKLNVYQALYIDKLLNKTITYSDSTFISAAQLPLLLGNLLNKLGVMKKINTYTVVDNKLGLSLRKNILKISELSDEELLALVNKIRDLDNYYKTRPKEEFDLFMNVIKERGLLPLYIRYLQPAKQPLEFPQSAPTFWQSFVNKMGLSRFWK